MMACAHCEAIQSDLYRVDISVRNEGEGSHRSVVLALIRQDGVRLQVRIESESVMAGLLKALDGARRTAFH